MYRYVYMGSTIAGHGYNHILRPSYSLGHSLTKYFILHYIFYFMCTDNLTKTNEISFNTLLLVIAYYEVWNFNSGNYLFTTDTK